MSCIILDERDRERGKERDMEREQTATNQSRGHGPFVGR